ncbi:NADP-dependent malic enzyme [Drosophila hydei]|uniref:NADP-dependent malic enzyme n=1 Tax=Drosophila hydei TaxID=7224 RepID=A0A6J1L8U8_DROHY|nr:NADP-dependent malic enzyme [Drosophila hydei]
MSSKKKQPQHECVDRKDYLATCDSVPIDRDTFWQTNEELPRNTTSGQRILRTTWLSKSTAFSHREQQLLSINGLIPFSVYSLEQQVQMCGQYFDKFQTLFQEYLFLSDLESLNRKLFYNLLISDPGKYMSVFRIAEFPSLIRNFSVLYTNNRGMYVTIKDRGHIYDVLRNWPLRHSVRYVMVTNGNNIMNLGDVGTSGAPVVFYKMYEDVAFGRMNPDFCLPLMMDLGTNNHDLLQNTFYMGVRESRTTGPELFEFFEEFTLAVMRIFGPRAVIQTQDFSPKETLQLLDLYQKRKCYMDISVQLYGTCGLAGLLGALSITEVKFRANTLLFYGLENFNFGLARMCMAYLMRQGLDRNAAQMCIWFCDAHGLVVHNRSPHKVPEELSEFSRTHAPIDTLLEVIEQIKPTVLVGCSAHANAFTKDILRAMERSCAMPIIFAMSKPLPLAECTAEDAFVYTKGRCIFISGCEMPPVKYANKWYQPSFCTDTYIHCGITLGIILSGLTNVPDELFLVAAERLASLVWPTDIVKRNVYPPKSKINCVNLQIAESVFTFAYRRRLATLWPEPSNPKEYIESMLFKSEYSDTVPTLYCTEDQNIGTSESVNYYKHNI